jgi:hypothetical protein
LHDSQRAECSRCQADAPHNRQTADFATSWSEPGR